MWCVWEGLKVEVLWRGSSGCEEGGGVVLLLSSPHITLSLKASDPSSSSSPLGSFPHRPLLLRTTPSAPLTPMRGAAPYPPCTICSVNVPNPLLPLPRPLPHQAIAAENYPFCTIDPNEGRCPVPDERYDFLCDLWQPPSK